MNTQERHYVPDLPTHPGVSLLETLENLQMSQAELADRMGRPRKTINEIIRGKTAITPETALQLEMVLGISASFWNKRESDYQEALAWMQQRTQLAQWVDWVNQIPYKDLMKCGWIQNQTNPSEIVQSVLSFFGVVSPEQWNVIWGNKLNIAFRRSISYSIDDFAVAAWIRKAEIMAQEIVCEEYDEGKFRKALDEIRLLTSEQPSAELYQERLGNLCRECGVAVVIVPRINKVSVFGVSQWLSPRKAMIALSLYFKTDDIFWYTFFHEAAHILLHSKKDVYIDLKDNDEYASSMLEMQANEFARDILIPQDLLQHFIRTRNLTSQGEPFFDEKDICRFARQLGIAPSVVVGRLQYDQVLQPRYKNEFKTMLDIEDEKIVIKRKPINCGE